jgi:hypothetical protein
MTPLLFATGSTPLQTVIWGCAPAVPVAAESKGLEFKPQLHKACIIAILQSACLAVLQEMPQLKCPLLSSQAITGVRGTAVRALKLCTSSPPATFHVLRAVLLLLGQPPTAVASWREASSQIHLGLFEQIAAYDATQERDAGCWKL